MTIKVLALGGLFCMCAASYAQDLNLETLPPPMFEWSRVDGTGAVIQECELSKNQALNCRTDREIKRVDCVPNFVFSSQPNVQNYKTKSVGTSFSCAPEKLPDQLNTSLRLYILSTDGKLSEYLLRFSSRENVEKTYLKEFSYVTQQKKDFFFDASAATFYELWSGSVKQTRYGLTGQASIGNFTTVNFVWIKPLGNDSTVGSDIGAGLAVAFGRLKSWSAGVGLEFLDRQSQNLQSTKVHVAYEKSLGLRFLKTKSELALRYPNVEIFRQAYEASETLAFGPFFKRRLSLELKATYFNQSWVLADQAPWPVSGFLAQAGVRYFFDVPRNAMQ